MKITQITNAHFGANPIKIVAEENKHLPHLYNEIMKATAVNGEHRSGQVIYRIGKISEIEILNPSKSLPAFLKQRGINYTV